MSNVRLVIPIRSASGRGDEYAEAWADYYDNVKHEDGCIQYELFRSTGNPDRFFVLELWRDRAAFDAHWRIAKDRPQLRLDLRADEPAAGGPRGIEIYWDRQEHHYDSATAQWRPNE